MPDFLKGFEYDEEGSPRRTVREGLGEALAMLARVEAPDHCMSRRAFLWGMEGRRVVPNTAKAILLYLANKGLVKVIETGGIKWSPLIVEGAAFDWEVRSAGREVDLELWDPVKAGDAARTLVVRNFYLDR